MISLAPGTKVFLACQPVDLRAGFDGLAAKVAADHRRRSVQRPSVHLSQQTGPLSQRPVLGRQRPVPVRQAA